MTHLKRGTRIPFIAIVLGLLCVAFVSGCTMWWGTGSDRTGPDATRRRGTAAGDQRHNGR